VHRTTGSYDFRTFRYLLVCCWSVFLYVRVCLLKHLIQVALRISHCLFVAALEFICCVYTRVDQLSMSDGVAKHRSLLDVENRSNTVQGSSESWTEISPDKLSRLRERKAHDAAYCNRWSVAWCVCVSVSRDVVSVSTSRSRDGLETHQRLV